MDTVDISVIKSNFQLVTVEIKQVRGTPWFFSTVYASLDSSQRRLLWEEHATLAASIDNSWRLAGDFNDTISLEERHGGREDVIDSSIGLPTMHLLILAFRDPNALGCEVTQHR